MISGASSLDESMSDTKQPVPRTNIQCGCDETLKSWIKNSDISKYLLFVLPKHTLIETKINRFRSIH